MSKQEYLLINIERKEGHLNHTLIEVVNWLDLTTEKICTTTLDPAFRNYKNWYTILTSPSPQGIYTNLKETTKTDKHNCPILSADSKPTRVEPVAPETVIEVMQNLFGIPHEA